MNVFEEDALIRVEADFSLSLVQEKVLTSFYLPLSGSSAFSLYHLLVQLADTEDRRPYMAGELADMASCLLSELQPALLKLEGLGLLKAYRKENGNKPCYLFLLKEPLKPFEILKEPCNAEFKKALLAKIGERKEAELEYAYRVNTILDKDYYDISVSFGDVFMDKEDISAFASLNGEDLNQYLFRNEKKKDGPSFQKDVFQNELEEVQIPFSGVENQYAEIARLSVLYALNEKEAAHLIAEKCMTSDGLFSLTTFQKGAMDLHHYGLKNVETEEGDETTFGHSDFAKRVRAYQEKTPLEFLSLCLNAEPPLSYKKTLNVLSDTYKAPNSLINAVIDYTVQKTGGSFPEQYAVKTVISLLKKGITDGGAALSELYYEDQKYKEKREKRASLIEEGKKELEKNAGQDSENPAGDSKKKNGGKDSDGEELPDFDIDKIVGGGV